MKLLAQKIPKYSEIEGFKEFKFAEKTIGDICLLYTSDAADE